MVEEVSARPVDVGLPAVIVCTTCRSEQGERGAVLAESLQREIARQCLGESVRVVAVDCLNACGEPVSLALTGEGQASYVFNHLEPTNDVADVVSTVKAWLDADRGFIEDASACGRLRFCLTARIPFV
ncbi:DUF1636 family protein [Fulvimarina pelagi]|uniref:DUF1636 family protein n=1 Tax=Fulvimarina pelagi TaxID=217511 RepID=UPI0009EA30A0|nr:DUF1636 family protein [Fulvimarina pelagi]